MNRVFEPLHTVSLLKKPMARDKYHDIVRVALEKDGWTITHDPYFLPIGHKRSFIDLGAERAIIGAERGKEKIAVEVKSFLAPSELDDFEDALEKFMLYMSVLELKEPDRVLFLAMPQSVFESLFASSIFYQIAERLELRLLVYNIEKISIEKWIR
ncbi:MAG: fatty-acid oxidation protein subunit alpha [Saprospiraceae bacterium]|nr:fatty-acid oxidation protein subunit alpha [Saprospiraceae bacterium]